MEGATASRQRRGGAGALALLLGFAALAGLAWAWLDVPRLIAWAQSQSGPLPALLLVPLQTAISLTLSPIPSDVVGLALGVVYGFWAGSALVWLGWMLAAWIEYVVVRRISRRLDPAVAMERLPHWLRRFPVEHPIFLICARWFPLGPHLVNGLSGLRGVPLWRYTWTAALGIAPVALVIAAIATGLAESLAG